MATILLIVLTKTGVSCLLDPTPIAADEPQVKTFPKESRATRFTAVPFISTIFFSLVIFTGTFSITDGFAPVPKQPEVLDPVTQTSPLESRIAKLLRVSATRTAVFIFSALRGELTTPEFIESFPKVPTAFLPTDQTVPSYFTNEMVCELASRNFTLSKIFLGKLLTGAPQTHPVLSYLIAPML